MYVLDVIAMSPSSPAGPLSYRSKERHKPGTIVSIMLRKTPVHGIVVAVTEVRDAKALLKNASFALAKSVRFAEGMLPRVLLDAAHTIALYHAVPLGAVLHALLSDALASDLPRILQEGNGYERRACEFPRGVRLRKYRTIIEETKKDGKATLITLPTIAELAEYKQEFADFKPIVLSGELKPEVRQLALNEAAESKGLVLATPAFSFVAVRALGHIIIERPSAGTYRMPRRPNLDRVRALAFLAEARAIPLTLGDYPLPLEYRRKPKDALHNTPAGTLEAVDLRAAFAQGEPWKSLPENTAREIKQVLKDRGSVLILAARKGYAPSVVCRDCGTTLKDERGRAYALTTIAGERMLRTADGKSIESAKALCSLCGSWNLLPLGVGIERVLEDVALLFPDEHVVRFDTDTIKTDAAARKAMKVYREKRGILVGTETVLPWLSYAFARERAFDLAVVASMDSLLALPFWRARERFVRIGLILRDRAERTLVQTRLPDDLALDAVRDPTAASFFLEETELRQAVVYPPFGTLIAFHIEGSQKRLLEGKIALVRAVLPRSLTLLPERTIGKNEFRLSALLHVPGTDWPEQELSERLQALPPFIRVSIDPETFW